MNQAEKETRSVRNYYVDEAGDGTLFNRKGKVIIGTEGCSRFFILGLVDIADPETLESDLIELRKKLLEDPYFSGVPSAFFCRRKREIKSFGLCSSAK